MGWHLSHPWAFEGWRHSLPTQPEPEKESALSLENGNNKILKGDYRSKAFYSTSDGVNLPGGSEHKGDQGRRGVE